MHRPFITVSEGSAPDDAQNAPLEERKQAAKQLGTPVDQVRFLVSTVLPDFPLAREYRAWWSQQSVRGKAGLVLQTREEFSAVLGRDGTALALRTLIGSGRPAHWTRVYFDVRDC